MATWSNIWQNLPGRKHHHEREAVLRAARFTEPGTEQPQPKICPKAVHKGKKANRK